MDQFEKDARSVLFTVNVRGEPKRARRIGRYETVLHSGGQLVVSTDTGLIHLPIVNVRDKSEVV